MKKERVVYFDHLRVFATLAVIVVHVVADYWYKTELRSLSWFVFTLIGSAVRCSVPLFLMISGSLFLSSETDLKKLYQKNILRMVISFFVWAAFYRLFELSIQIIRKGEILPLVVMLRNLVSGSGHLWFIPMIVGQYICIPILKPMVSHKKTVNYFLILSFVFAIFLPQTKTFFNDFVTGPVADIILIFCSFLEGITVHPLMGYSFYFVLGYALGNIDLSKKQRNVIYILGLLGFLSTALLTALISRKTGKACETYFGYLTVNVVLEAVAVHTWFKYRDYTEFKANKMIVDLSRYSFGAYLIHPFFISVLQFLNSNTIMLPAIASIPVFFLAVTVLSFAVSFVLNKIPLINKWCI